MRELSLVTVMLVGLLYMCYRFGQKQERKAYTAHFVQEVEAAYEDGRADGVANCELKYRVRDRSVCN